MFSSSMFMEDNDLSSGKDNSVDNEFFAKLVDDLFLDNEYFTFPTADNSSSTAATITQSAATTASSSANSNSSYESSLILSPPASNLSMNSASDSDGSCLSPLSQPDEIVSTPIMAYPAPAPLAIITGMNSNTASSSTISNSQSTISSKRSRDFSDNLFSFDNVASKVFAASANPVKKRKDNEAVAKPVAMSTTSAPKKNFIGVTYHAPSNRFRARIKIDNKTTHLGYFTTEYEAAVAYDRAAYELRGAKAHLNFDQSVIDQSIQFDDNLPIRDRCVAAAKSAAGVVQTAA